MLVAASSRCTFRVSASGDACFPFRFHAQNETYCRRPLVPLDGSAAGGTQPCITLSGVYGAASCPENWNVHLGLAANFAGVAPGPWLPYSAYVMFLQSHVGSVWQEGWLSQCWPQSPHPNELMWLSIQELMCTTYASLCPG